ncbi:MAG TPA: DUF2911 domain-containing protein [Vicinamibacterales bacterium]|nr:DUF2911 domain-containing protein [Vicinamibacterales bacterium]
MTRKFSAAAVVAAMVCAAGAVAGAQEQRRPASPAGSSAVEVGGKYDPKAAEPTYVGGKWIEITYGRPILRGRDVFGKPDANYGKVANPDQPVWRAGANVTTQLKTEVPLVINGKTVAPGTYTMFVDLKPNNWTLIVSDWKAQTRYDPNNKQEIWGGYNYTPDKDVVRAKMTLETPRHSFEQLSWQFVDMTPSGGTIALLWDKNVATVPFKIGM